MKKLKIWNTPWHLAHNFDMMKALEPIADFYLLVNYTRRWGDETRPLPDNVKWVTHFEKNKYDFCLLHLDQQCTNFDLNKAVLIRHMKKAIRAVDKKIPIVYINHGTPVYPELYDDASKETNYISKKLIKEIKKIVGKDHMVVNSKQASKDWGWGHPIWHGMGKDEWICNEDKEPRVACFISKAGIGDKYYNRSYLIAVMEILKIKHAINLQWINYPGCFVSKDSKQYKEFLSKTLVYFNPTYASPMPRSRTEAMLSGCCVVTTKFHDAEEFIEHGKNGILVPHDKPDEVADLIASLLKEYKTAYKMGEEGRKTALKTFSRARYRKDWVSYLTSLNILK